MEAGHRTVSRTPSLLGNHCLGRDGQITWALQQSETCGVMKCETLGEPPPTHRQELGGGCLAGRNLGANQELKIVQFNCKVWGAVEVGEGGEVGQRH